jgi:hypothetical protein
MFGGDVMPLGVTPTSDFYIFLQLLIMADTFFSLYGFTALVGLGRFFSSLIYTQ